MTELAGEHLFFKYREADRWVLEDISFHLKIGDFVILNGPNGAGKTTLLSIVLRFLKPTSGRLLYPHQKLFSYLPQRGTYDTVPLKVLDVLSSAFVDSHTLFFIKNKQAREKGMAILEHFHLEDLAHRRFSSLSGGQMQKILLCRVFINPSPFILLDEPFSNMDESSKELFLEELKKCQHTSGILCISHDMNLIGNHHGAFWYLGNSHLSHYASVGEWDKAFFHQTYEQSSL